MAKNVKCWSRWSLAQLTADDSAFEECDVKPRATVEKTKGQIQLHLWHDPNGNNLIVRVLSARGLHLQDMPNQELPNPYALLYLLPNREISGQFKTNTDSQTVTPKWDLSFIFANISEDELSCRTLEVTLWSEDQTRGDIFLGEVLVELTPEILGCEAQSTWFDLMDHNDTTHSFPMPMHRRHSMTSEPVLERDGKMFWEENDAKGKKHSDHGPRLSIRLSLSSVELSRRSPSADRPDDIALLHLKQRRIDSVVKAGCLCGTSKPEFSEQEIGAVEEGQEKRSGCKCNSAPCTPGIMSVQTSAEDLRQKRFSTPSLKSAITLSEYLAQNRLPEAKPVVEEPEVFVKDEKEGKKKGALKTILYSYPANLKIRWSGRSERHPTLGEDAEIRGYGPMSQWAPGYNSAPVTPNRSSSTEDLQRERSYTNYNDYLQVPPSPGFISRLFPKRYPDMTSPLAVGPHEGMVPPSPGVFTRRLSRQSSTHRSPAEAANATPTEIKQKEFYFSYPRTHLSNLAEQEPSIDKEPELAVAAQEIQNQNKRGRHRKLSASPDVLAMADSSPTQDAFVIPEIKISPTGIDNDEPEFNLEKEHHTEPHVEPEKAEVEVEKKGAMRALRKYSKRFSSKMPEKDHLYGEDPEKGVIGPGQIRRGSHQGHELGYINVGLSAIRGTLEVEIIRAVGILDLGDHLPDTYVKTYLINDQIRMLKRKTSITRQSVNPVYNCKIKYPGRDLHNKELLVSVWCKQGIFGRKVLLGEVRIALASLDLRVKQASWYKLFIEHQLSE